MKSGDKLIFARRWTVARISPRKLFHVAMFELGTWAYDWVAYYA